MEKNKKKIKLITFAPHPNFGTCLQAYALNKILLEMGHDVVFIYNERETPPVSLSIRIIAKIKSFVRKITPFWWYQKLKGYRDRVNMQRERHSEALNNPYILELPNHPILAMIADIWPGFEIWLRKPNPNIQWKKVLKFMFHDDNFKMKRIWTHKQYMQINKETDLYITGSDQIWNPYCGGYNPMMFVEFGENVRRIAYSSSISQPSIHPSIHNRMMNALSKFSHIGVRERLSVDILNHELHRTDVRLVVDPTYLLTEKQWSAFGKKAEIEFVLPDHYIFCYFVGYRPVFDEMVEEVKKHTGIKEVIALECYNRTHVYGNGRLYSDAGPYEWVYLLEHADYICMDSFHATVFSLKFKKDFVVAMKNKDEEIGSQNGRMYDILSRYGLSNKIFTEKKCTTWKTPINYDEVTPIIDSEIDCSMEFLKKEINGE